MVALLWVLQDTIGSLHGLLSDQHLCFKVFRFDYELQIVGQTMGYTARLLLRMLLKSGTSSKAFGFTLFDFFGTGANCIRNLYLELINMPKRRRDRSVSFERPRKSPVPCSSSMKCKSKAKSSPPSEEDLKEWEDARCPVCMEHPHNAVLLVCSAYDKGCRPYMCDTSYRHSNCLDQFRKSFVEGTPEMPSEEGVEPPLQSSEIVSAVETLVTSQEEGKSQGPVTAEFASMHKLQQKLVCPLCRGQISGWVVVDLARDFMNGKSRSCTCETCEFNGNYTDLRKHARSDHPQVRPSEADPERQRSWRRLERQRDIGDVLSTIQSTFGDDQDDLPMDERGWITMFFLFRIWRPSSSPRAGQSASIEHDDSSDDDGSGFRRRVRIRLAPPSDDEV